MIVIGTNYGREHWAQDCIDSITGPYIVVCGPGYEVGHIKWVYDNTDIERFIYLQDSFVIKDNSLVEEVFSREGSVCLMCSGPHPQSYTALYERSTLSKMTEIPFAKDKAEAMYWEENFILDYRKVVDTMTCFPLTQNITWGVMKHGRENMFYDNELYQKYKGNWGQKSPSDSD